ncbi:nucleoprotein [Orgi virus]|uniref:Nucleoprotein n=1 Tax=Orgi virus TaxID=1911434 RepID=A0A2Z2CP58_9RHAB|nr:nucleoprotein [Orgi virus]AOX47519.1 nucleoprotein [Orgi virus]
MDFMTRVSTKKAITPRAPTSKLDVQYPHAFFSDPPTKPVLNFVLTSNSLQESAELVYQGILNNSIDLDYAKTFLYYFGLTMTDRLTEDWTSYGVKIGAIHEEVNAWCMYSRSTTVTKKDGVSAPVRPELYPKIALVLLSIYRFIRIANQEYRSNMIQRMNAQIESGTSSALAISETLAVYTSWQGDRIFNKLVAGIDMFLMRFPQHQWGHLRLGTIGSRFRDCAALLSYGYLMKQLGTSKSIEILDWVFVESIGDDIDQMMKKEEELDQPYSYFPYQVDMGLVHKSAFSTVANPHFYFFAHAIGTLLLSERSKNAIQVLDGSIPNILYNAIIVAFVHSKSHSIEKVYTAEGKALVVESETPDETTETDSDVYSSKNASEWFVFLRTLKGELPARIHSFFKRSISKLTNVREGTIAQFLQKDPVYSEI